MKGKEFTFAEHDTFIIGRSLSATCCISNDPYVSRCHFIIEANPPHARLKDLGSTNGTYVNSIKYGGKNGTVHEIDLKHNDIIEIGKTAVKVIIERENYCKLCGKELHEENHYREKDDSLLCNECYGKDAGLEKNKVYEVEKTQIFLNKENKEAQETDQKIHEFVSDFLNDINLTSVGNLVKNNLLPGYHFMERLGEGATSSVYKAMNNETNQAVAVKIINPDADLPASQIQRFVDRDIKICSGLNHTNIVRFYDSLIIKGLYVMVMEYVKGDALSKLAQEQKFINTETLCRIILQVLYGLEYLHDHDIIHRDIKPENILVANNSEEYIAKIADFGISKDIKNSMPITKTNDLGGSIPYMPPEQIIHFKELGKNKQLGQYADIFSLGATIYTLICGKYVRDYPDNMDIITTTLEGPIVPIEKRQPTIHKELARLINKAISPKPENRFKNASEMKKKLMLLMD